MSHAWGHVIKDGKIVGYYEYNGTADVVLPKIWATSNEMQEHWREDDPFDRNCTCGDPPEDVVLYSSYGNGFHWPWKACLKCGVIEPWYADMKERSDTIVGHPLGYDAWGNWVYKAALEEGNG